MGRGRWGSDRGRAGFILGVKGNLGWVLPIVSTFGTSANLPLKRGTGPQIQSPERKKLLDEHRPHAIARLRVWQPCRFPFT